LKLEALRESDLGRFEKVVDGTPLHHYLLEQDRWVWIMDVSRELRKYGLLLKYTFLDADWDWSKVLKRRYTVRLVRTLDCR